MTELFRIVFFPGTIALLIPLCAIIGAFVIKSQKMHYAHVERLARLRQEPDEDTLV